METRPWLMIVLLAAFALYLLYGVAAAAYYFLQQGHSLALMKAYITPAVIAVVCLAASVSLYFGHRWAHGLTIWLRGGIGGFITPETPTWLSLTLLVLMWCANAGMSLVLWMLAIGNPMVGYSFVAFNALGILVSLWLYFSGRRRAAVKGLIWVVPAALLFWLILALLPLRT